VLQHTQLQLKPWRYQQRIDQRKGKSTQKESEEIESPIAANGCDSRERQLSAALEGLLIFEQEDTPNQVLRPRKASEPSNSGL
jgi:hypothetical protein